MNFPFFLLLIIIQIKCEDYFNSFETNIITEGSSLIDISDYYNISLIITTDKKIYTGIPPTFKNSIYSKISEISSAVTYNNNYTLMACTDDYLLIKINIETGEEVPLVNYTFFTIPNCTCSISTKDNYVYIGISNIITPYYKIKKWDNRFENYTDLDSFNSTELNNTNEIDDSNYYFYYDYNNTYLVNSLIKIKLKNDGDNIDPLLDEAFDIVNYTIQYKHKNLENLPLSRPLSCEIVNVKNIITEEPRLICGYIIANETSKDSFDYLLINIVMNSDFNDIEDETITKYKYKIMPYIKLQKINSTHIRYIASKISYEVALKKEGDKYKIEITNDNKNLHKFQSSGSLFFYNNHYLFSADTSFMYIKKNISEHYLQVIEKSSLKKLMGYYESERDILLFIYELCSNEIKYFTIENTSLLYDFKINPTIIKVISNTTTFFDVGELIETPKDHNPLSFNYLIHYISTTNYNLSYENYNFEKETQNLTIYESLNDWITFFFYYDGKTKGYHISFFLEKCKVTIKTCLFKCGQCSLNFENCDLGSCKENFALFRDDQDNGCYPKEQNFPTYIYDKETNYFEKCYETCTFCSKKVGNSSQESQNCKACEDGYLKSYKFPGNCYGVEYPYNTSEYYKNVNSINDENFTLVNSCLLYQINETGECVDSCPKDTVYYNYYLNESLNFSGQEESYIGLLYPLEIEKIPKFLFNNICYSICPELTYEDKNSSTCKCKYAWHRDPDTQEIICYNKTDYCKSKEYYYHHDDKECVLNGCKTGYYQTNFECYKDGCPKGSRQISSDIKKCESNLKYCYIDENFLTQCSSNKIEGFNFKFNNTNTYLISCNDSIDYFNITTYLYQKTCYQFCPEETTKNDTNERCACNYYIYYNDDEKSDYECLKETEKCWDKKRYNITDKNECVKTKEECTRENYTIFNDECLNECPENTEPNADRICLCKYYFYNDSNFLNCFEENATCETEGYLIKMSNTSECFKNKFECLKRGYKFYNNDCIERCPDTTIEKDNDGICSCHYNYFNDSDILDCFASDETCQNKGKNYTNIDTNECFDSLESCINRELKIFNGNCYSKCPTNTKSNGDNSYCICADYFYREDNGTLKCFGSKENCSASSDYLYTNVDTKECFKTRDDCINKGYKIFNFECYLSSCPDNTLDKNNDNICLCSSYFLYDENNLLRCFSSGEECASKGYYFSKETKECFLSSDNCTAINKKLFGKECVTSCPANSQLKDGSNICECLYYYYNDNGILECFNFDETCESKGYEITSDTKECFTTINECFSNNYNYYYYKSCYKDNCPSGKVSLNSMIDGTKKEALINELGLDSILSQKLCVCDTYNTYLGWINRNDNIPLIQKCLYQCPTDYDLNSVTDKCYYSCNPETDYTFNENCYKNCPEGTHPDSGRICICDGNIKTDENGLIACEDIYPSLFYEDPKACPYFYNETCFLKCPDNTCLTPNNKDLAKCIDIKPNTKVVNQICINGIEELIGNLEDDEIEPIISSSGVSISAFSTEASIEVLIEKYPELTFVDLEDCKEKLISAYDLSSDTKLFILGYDTPSLDDSSSINVFNFEVYLKNGTQLKDISACDDTKITISSRIKDLDSVNYESAMKFYGEGYDIYNRTSIFYVDPCSPAQDNGNDITLADRAKYYFPNVSLCNDGCIYKVVDFTNQRFLCDCNANLSDKIYRYNYENNEIEEEKDSSYFHYFLSLINYKIFLCINLFFEFESFYYNAGFYISFVTLLICIMLMILFWIIGMKFIKIQIYKNLPTKEKLLELLNKKRKKMIKIQKHHHHHHHHDEKHKKHKDNIEIIKNKVSSLININNTHEKNNKKKSIKKNEDNKARKHRDKNEKKFNNRTRPKYINLTKANLLNSNNNPPPKNKNIIKLNQYVKTRSILKENIEKNDENYENHHNNNLEIYKKDTIDKNILNDNNLIDYNMKTTNLIEKKKSKYHIKKIKIINEKNIKALKSPKNQSRIQKIKTTKSSAVENNSSNDNLKIMKINNKIRIKEKPKIKRKEKVKINNNLLITKREDVDELNSEENIQRKKKRSKSQKIQKNLLKNSSSKDINNIQIKSIKPLIKIYKTEIIKYKKNLLDKFRLVTDETTIYIQNKKKLLEDLELKIDFNFTHLIDRTDDDIEPREINNIPYRQALRIDKRPFIKILISVLTNQIEVLSLFLYRHPYSHFTLTVSIYLFELLLDLTMNCFLYTDDVVSEKYHNDGNLSMFTSLSLSFISNIISSFTVFIIAKLTNYTEIIEAIITNVKDKKKYITNVVRLFKYIKLRLGFFYFLQLGFILVMTYYLFIFCTVYHQSQGSIMVNYIIGACISLAISAGLTLIISILRALSIKYHHYQLFNISKYLYEHF